MRFKPEPPDLSRIGTRRTVREFLYLPRSITGETRWLEEASILQECSLETAPWIPGSKVLKWYDVAWADTTTTKPE